MSSNYVKIVLNGTTVIKSIDSEFWPDVLKFALLGALQGHYQYLSTEEITQELVDYIDPIGEKWQSVSEGTEQQEEKPKGTPIIRWLDMDEYGNVYNMYGHEIENPKGTLVKMVGNWPAEETEE